MLLNYTNDDNSSITKEKNYLIQALSFAKKNKDTLSLCISKLSGNQLKEASSLFNTLQNNIKNLENLGNLLDKLASVPTAHINYAVNEYNNLFLLTFNQLFTISSNIDIVSQYVMKNIVSLSNTNTNTDKNISTNIDTKNVQPAYREIPSNSTTLTDNNTLLISEKEDKVFLPYKKKNIENILTVSKKYNTAKEVIDDIYTVPLSKYNNSASARFREGFNLMRKKECGSIFQSLDLGLELLARHDLNPAIISACENLNELDAYLDCLDDNTVNQFKLFNIKYEVTPSNIPNIPPLKPKKHE